MSRLTENSMPILAIETSGNLCSAAVLSAQNIYSESKVYKKNIHSEILFELMEDSLFKLKLTISNIHSIAISEGPGSFTGLRIGMAAAKGIAEGRNIPIISVPTFDAFAFEICNFIKDGEDFCIANKASRDEYYFASYKKKQQQIISTAKLRVVKKELVKQLGIGTTQIFGNYSEIMPFDFSSPSAISIARWAYLYGKDLLSFDYDFLEPNYFKNFKVKVKK